MTDNEIRVTILAVLAVYAVGFWFAQIVLAKTGFIGWGRDDQLFGAFIWPILLVFWFVIDLPRWIGEKL